MISVRSLLVVAGVFGSCLLASAVDNDESPRALVEAAFQAHGGADSLSKTLCANVKGYGRMTVAPWLGVSIRWEENYEMPHRYRRAMEGDGVGPAEGKTIRTEFAVTEVGGWLRQDGQVRDLQGDKSLGSKSWFTWLTVLSKLPSCLGDGVKLRSAGMALVDDKPAQKVIVTGDALRGSATLFLDEKTHRLVKVVRRVPNPTTGVQANGEFLFRDFKEVQGVVFPHRLLIDLDGKRYMQLEITRIDFPKTLDDKLFAKPE
jgi:hypothetical protein